MDKLLKYLTKLEYLREAGINSQEAMDKEEVYISKINYYYDLVGGRIPKFNLPKINLPRINFKPTNIQVIGSIPMLNIDLILFCNLISCYKNNQRLNIFFNNLREITLNIINHILKKLKFTSEQKKLILKCLNMPSSPFNFNDNNILPIVNTQLNSISESSNDIQKKFLTYLITNIKTNYDTCKLIPTLTNEKGYVTKVKCNITDIEPEGTTSKIILSNMYFSDYLFFHKIEDYYYDKHLQILINNLRKEKINIIKYIFKTLNLNINYSEIIIQFLENNFNGNNDYSGNIKNLDIIMENLNEYQLTDKQKKFINILYTMIDFMTMNYSKKT